MKMQWINEPSFSREGRKREGKRRGIERENEAFINEKQKGRCL
jgi:hypothetical protein